VNTLHLERGLFRSPRLIDEAIDALQKKLADPKIKNPENAGVKEGVETALMVLLNRVYSYSGIPGSLTTDQGRAIAVLAVDFLNGKNSKEVLTSIPLR